MDNLKPGTKVVLVEEGYGLPVGTIGHTLDISALNGRAYLVEFEDKNATVMMIASKAIAPWHWLKKVFKHGPKITKRSLPTAQ